MTIPGFSTTTELTKHLRSKTTPVSEILSISQALIDDQLSVYLPSKAKFLLELLVDRLNDAKLKYEDFKGNKDVWRLYLDICGKADPNVVKVTFQSFRFLEDVYAALKDNNSDFQLFRVLADVLRYVRVSGFLSLGTSQADLPLLITSAYLRIFNILDSQVDSELILEITKFYKALNSSHNDSATAVNAEGKSTKKHQDQFITTALPHILTTLTSIVQNFRPLELMVKPYLTSTVEPTTITMQLLKHKPSVSSECLVTYYKLLSSFHSISPSSITEPSFLSIVKEHPETIHALLEHTLATSRSLSFDFLTEIYQTEIAKKKNQINWGLIVTVVKLNIEIGIQFTDQILTALDSVNNLNYEIIKHVTEELIKAYIKVRSFPQLYDLVLNLNLAITQHTTFHSLVTSYVKQLTPLEIKQCIESNLQASKLPSQAKYGYLNAIIQGFFEITDQVTLAQSRELFKSILNVKQDVDEEGLWFAKFQILCLYEDLLSEEELLALTSKKVNGQLYYYYFFIFRARELTEFDIGSKTIPSFVKFANDSASKEQTRLIWKRWFILINELFTNEQIKSLIVLLLKSEDIALVREILANELIFENLKIMESMIDTLTSSKSDNLSSFAVEVLLLIPIECYGRRFKVPLIDKLTKTKSKDIESVRLIEHVLETPTFKSAIESDVNELIDYLSKIGTDALGLFKLVLEHHVSNAKEDISLKFVNELIDILEGAMNKKKKKNNKFVVSVHHRLASSVIELISQKRDSGIDVSKLTLILLDSIKKVTSNESEILSTVDLAFILETLTQLLPLTSSDHNELKPSLINISSTSIIDITIKAKLFSYFTTNANLEDTNAVNLVYYMALYIALRTEGCAYEDLKSGLRVLLGSVDEVKFYEGLSSVLVTLSSEDKEEVGALIELLGLFIGTLSKESKQESCKWFVKILNTVITHMVKLSVDDLNSILEVIQSVLTTQSYLITQFSLELIITLLSTLISITSNPTTILFENACLVTSLILALQRYRLSSRHHVIISLFITLLTKLSQSQELRESKSAAMSYQRLLANLCDPTTSTSTSTQSTSASQAEIHQTQSKIKSQLRATLPPLLLSYIHTQLQSPFPPQTTVLILPGIHAIFDVLSQDELILVNASVDSSSRAYLRVVADGYRDTGKWRG